MEADILRFLEHYPSGFTADELQEAFEGKLHPGVQAGTIAARLRGLELKEQILKTKETRRTRSNRQAQVWKHPRHCTPSEIAGAEPEKPDTGNLTMTATEVILRQNLQKAALVLSASAATFRRYQQLHAAKPDMAKAEANEICALACESTLREIGYGHWVQEVKQPCA